MIDRAADIHRENMKKKRREMEQASIDAASDLLDTDSNATFAMVGPTISIAELLRQHINYRFLMVIYRNL